MLKETQVRTQLESITEAGKEVITTQAQGACLIEESGILLRYTEDKNHGTATLIVSESLVQLQRQGDVVASLTFIEQQLIPAKYAIAQKHLDFSIYTHSRDFLLNAQGGRLRVCYSILLSGTHLSDNTLEIVWNFK